MPSIKDSTAYCPDPRIPTLIPWLGDPVLPADFPETILRWRNQRAAETVGLGDLSDSQWITHFARFEPLPNNLTQPLALRYHGHQFHVYNPELGDGRGFLFAQMRDNAGRLLDLGTKGSGQTPWSRHADGRLTLKGAVRELLASEMLDALGVNTSKTFSIIETGEELWRGDEPSPTRSAVLVRLSHGHIRIGSFQRLSTLQLPDEMAELIQYCLTTFPGPLPPDDAPGRDEPAVILMHQVVARLAGLAASYMVAGFVHGVLNTDNMNISGESFDYGPWRWLPAWDPGFTAAYFDHSGLYAFGRQPEAILWNVGRFGAALRLLAKAEPLMAAIDRFGPIYEQELTKKFLHRLGIISQGRQTDTALITAAEQYMAASGESPDAVFFRYRGARHVPEGEFGNLLKTYRPAFDDTHPVWQRDLPPTLVIEEVERIWDAIAEHDDWAPLHAKIDDIRALGAALEGKR